MIQWQTLSAASKDFTSKKPSGQYLIRNAASNGMGWGLTNQKPSDLSGIQTLRAIFKETSGCRAEDFQDAAAILKTVKQIKNRYDVKYSTTKNKILLALKLFFTGRNEKLEIHRLYKQIKENLGVEKKDDALNQRILERVNAVKDKSIFDYFLLSTSDRKIFNKIIIDPSIQKKIEISDAVNDLFCYLGLKNFPEKNFKEVFLEQSKGISELNQIKEVSSDHYDDFNSEIIKLQIINKSFYTAYKAVYDKSKTPRPLEGMRLALFGATQRDRVEEIYKSNRQYLEQLKEILQKKSDLSVKASEGAEKVLDKTEEALKKGVKLINNLFSKKKK